MALTTTIMTERHTRVCDNDGVTEAFDLTGAQIGQPQTAPWVHRWQRFTLGKTDDPDSARVYLVHQKSCAIAIMSALATQLYP